MQRQWKIVPVGSPHYVKLIAQQGESLERLRALNELPQLSSANMRLLRQTLVEIANHLAIETEKAFDQNHADKTTHEEKTNRFRNEFGHGMPEIDPENQQVNFRCLANTLAHHGLLCALGQTKVGSIMPSPSHIAPTIRIGGKTFVIDSLEPGWQIKTIHQYFRDLRFAEREEAHPLHKLAIHFKETRREQGWNGPKFYGGTKMPNALVHWNNGVYFVKNGRYDEVVKEAKKMIQTHPDAPGHYLLAMGFLGQGHPKKAIHIFESVPKDQCHYGVYLNWAIALSLLGKFSEADDKFTISAEKNPQDPDVFIFWSKILNEQGRTKEAAEKLERARRLDPEGKRINELNGDIKISG